METEKEELIIPWLEEMKERQETPPDPDYVTMQEEIEHRRGKEGIKMEDMYNDIPEELARKMEAISKLTPEDLAKMQEEALKQAQETLSKLTPEERQEAEIKAQQIIEEDKRSMQEMLDRARKISEGSTDKPVPKFCTNCGSPVNGGKFCSNCGHPQKTE